MLFFFLRQKNSRENILFFPKYEAEGKSVCFFYDIFLWQQVETERCKSIFLSVALTQKGQKTAYTSGPWSGTPAEG